MPSGGGSATVANVTNQYKFNGQEWQSELGLNITAMDFRQYDNAIGRFVCTDPITHFNQSPYHFANNNPMYFADPSGMDGRTSTGLYTNAYGVSSSPGYNGYSGVVSNHGAYAGGFLSMADSAQDLVFYTGNPGEIAAVGNYLGLWSVSKMWVSGGEGYGTNSESVVFSGYWEKTNFTKEIISNASAFSEALDNKGGSFRLNKGGSFRLNKGGSFSFKYYDSNWIGGSAANIKTYNISNVLKKSSIALTVVLSVKDISNGVSEDYKNYTQTGTTNGFNTSVATAKVAAGVAVGWAAGAATGAAIGSLVPIPLVGTFVGAVVGGIAGYYASEGAADLVKSAYK